MPAYTRRTASARASFAPSCMSTAIRFSALSWATLAVHDDHVRRCVDVVHAGATARPEQGEQVTRRARSAAVRAV